MEMPTLDDNLKTVEAKPAPPDLRRPKRNCLIQLFAIGLFGGFIQGIGLESIYMIIEYVTGIAGTLMAIRWCYLDADERDVAISFRLSLLMLLLFVVGFPYYILKTRQNIQALKVLGIAFGIFVAYCILATLANELGCMIYNARHAY